VFVDTEEDREGEEVDLWRMDDVHEKSLKRSPVPKRDISLAMMDDDCGLVGVSG
jgi:hypothetical protein